MACASVLVFFHLPLPWDSDDPLVLPPIYLFGVWLSIVVAIGVTSLYAFQVAEEARKLSDALAATELVLTREQHLTQLDGLAAAAAHELGTPLSTIFLISRELEQSLQDNSQVAGDIKTLREQAQRCRDILAKITQLSSTGAPFDRMPLSTLIEETVAPHRDFGVAIKVRIAVAGTSRAGRNPQSGDPLWRRQYPGKRRRFRADDGGGECVVERRYRRDHHFRRRSRDSRPTCSSASANPICRGGAAPDDAQSEHRGLGLGVFIARTLLERTGAKVSFTNRIFPDHGAVVQIAWPRQRFEAGEISTEPVP